METWRTIPEFPQYDVSDAGNVRSRRLPIDGRRSHRPMPHLMVPYVTPLGYRQVILLKPGQTKAYRRFVHRLVALAFLPNPENCSDVAHEDGVPGHDHVGNLRWATHTSNQLDMRRHGTMQDGEKCVTAKLTAEQVEQIKAAKEIFGRGVQVVLAARFGMGTAQISRIVNGRRWASTY